MKPKATHHNWRPARQRTAAKNRGGGEKGNEGRKEERKAGRMKRKKETSLQGGWTYSLRGETSKLPATGMENKN